MRGLLCWHIWKDRNPTIFTNKALDPHGVIQKVWYQLGVQVKVEWSSLLAEVRQEKISLADAHNRIMTFLFGKVGVVWAVEDIWNQVSPCPP